MHLGLYPSLSLPTDSAEEPYFSTVLYIYTPNLGHPFFKNLRYPMEGYADINNRVTGIRYVCIT